MRSTFVHSANEYAANEYAANEYAVNKRRQQAPPTSMEQPDMIRHDRHAPPRAHG